MLEIKIPGPMRMIWACLGCYWLAGIINKGFYTPAGISLLFIPVLLAIASEASRIIETEAKPTPVLKEPQQENQEKPPVQS